MGEIADFMTKRFEHVASRFVDIYENKGPDAAAEWAIGEIDGSQYDEVQPYIRREFEARGYTFGDTE